MFDIPVKIEGIERRRRSVGLFHILAGLFLAANASLLFKQLNYTGFWMLLPIFSVSLASLIYGLFRKNIDVTHKYNKYVRWLQLFTFLLTAAVGWSSVSTIRSISIFLWAAICLALLLTERWIFNRPSVQISNDRISVPGSISPKKINWSDLEDVIVRQDYITFNYANNQYLQYEVSEVLTGTEIERINLYCREQLSKAELQKETISGS